MKWREGEKKEEEEKRGGVKTTFPCGSFGKTALRKLPKLLTHTFPHWHAHMHGSLLPSHMRYTTNTHMDGGMWEMCVCVCELDL